MKEEGQSHGGRRVEDKRRDVEFFGDVEGVGAEEVDDEGGGGEGAELVAEGREGVEDGEGDDGFDFGVWGKV